MAAVSPPIRILSLFPPTLVLLRVGRIKVQVEQDTIDNRRVSREGYISQQGEEMTAASPSKRLPSHLPSSFSSTVSLGVPGSTFRRGPPVTAAAEELTQPPHQPLFSPASPAPRIPNFQGFKFAEVSLGLLTQRLLIVEA